MAEITQTLVESKRGGWKRLHTDLIRVLTVRYHVKPDEAESMFRAAMAYEGAVTAMGEYNHIPHRFFVTRAYPPSHKIIRIWKEEITA